MIGVDSNVLVRFFVKDDQQQTELAHSFLAARTRLDPAFVSPVVLAEVVWALDSIYGYQRDRIHTMLELMIGSANVLIEREDLIVPAIETARARNADIADCIIAALAQDAGCSVTMTFDKPASRRVPGMELLA